MAGLPASLKLQIQLAAHFFPEPDSDARTRREVASAVEQLVDAAQRIARERVDLDELDPTVVELVEQIAAEGRETPTEESELLCYRDRVLAGIRRGGRPRSPDWHREVAELCIKWWTSEYGDAPVIEWARIRRRDGTRRSNTPQSDFTDWFSSAMGDLFGWSPETCKRALNAALADDSS